MPSLKDLATLPASATHLILEGMGDEAAAALRARRDVRGVLFRADRGTFSDAGMATLAKLPDLRALKLDGTRSVTIEGWRRIGEMRSLTEIGLRSLACDRATMSTILRLPGLVTLELTDVTGLDDGALAAIAGCSQMRCLELRGMPGLHERAIARIAELTSLEVLFLSGLDALSDDVLAKLQSLKRLRWLSLRSNRVTSDGLRALAGMRDLRRLNLTGEKIGTAGLLHIPVTLEVLHLEDCRGLDESTGKVLRDRFPSLKRLSIDRGAWLTDEVVVSILQAPSLVSLNLSLCDEVTAGGFADVAKAAVLQRIAFEMCDRISAADGEAMQKVRRGLKVEVVD